MERKTHNPGSQAGEPQNRGRQTFLPAPTPEEIARRQLVFAETFKLRDSVGTIDLSTEELLGEEDEVDA